MMLGRLARIGLLGSTAVAGAASAAVIAAAPAFACNVAAGSSCSPDQLTISPSATVVATKSGTITPNPPNYTATYTETVYRDPDNTLCAYPGQCLTWGIEVTMHTSGTDTIRTVGISNFAGFVTDVGYTPPPTGAPGMSNPNGGVVPELVDRTSNGQVVHWRFRSPGQEVGNGQTTVLLVVETNATRTVQGTILTQDGVSGSDNAYGPALPEVMWVPAAGLLGAAIAGGWYYRRRRSSTQR